MKKEKLNHIELFAGCGGMSIGLDAAGYDLYFANELSPMAGETFAYNILNETLEGNSEPNKTLWIKSQFPKDKIEHRLRENPFEACNGKYSDIDKKTDLKGKLLIGDINQLLQFLNENPKLVSQIQKEDIDLLSGGPPCQSFSLAGKREKDNHKNTLPLSFAQITGLIKPKTVLLENVKGITSPFTQDGEKYFAWFEVAKAFALEGYVPVCIMLNSKYFGVAQNRPRYIMFAYRLDVFNKILKTVHSKHIILEPSGAFYKKVNDNIKTLQNVTIDDLKYYDIENNQDLFNGVIFPKMTTPKGSFVTASEAIGDIRRTNVEYELSNITSDYAVTLNTMFLNNNIKASAIKNHEPRKHSYSVKARFRFYQVISEFQNGIKKGAVDLFAGKKVDTETLHEIFKEFSQHNLLFNNGIGDYYKKPENLSELRELLETIPSKKNSQRALKEFEPAPAQLTIPDDFCHYHIEDLRTMTVREMARFQSFPDWFEFKSKVTTGGKMRKFEVPQYTQVGNAVPPLLAKALGEALKEQLMHINLKY